MRSDPASDLSSDGASDAISTPLFADGSALAQDQAERPPGLLLREGLSLATKLLLLTVSFIMLAEVLIFIPSVANFRLNWLADRLMAARIAALAAEAAENGSVPEMLRNEILMAAQVKSVALKRGSARRLIMQEETMPMVDGMFDLRESIGLSSLTDAIAVLMRVNDRCIRIISGGFNTSPDVVEIAIMEQPLRAAMVAFGTRVLSVSVVISISTAALVYLALNSLLVRPVRRIVMSMMRFSARPEDSSRIIVPTGRSDEIGTAERQLAAMQREISQALIQKTRLAALGLAVSKINHDLRNILATSQLITDRFQASEDPTVKRLAPKLINSLDRAIQLCADTLRYGRAEEAPPNRRLFALRPLVEEIGEALGLPQQSVVWVIDVDPALMVDADPDQLFRVLSNIGRNALQVLTSGTRQLEPDQIKISARRGDGAVTVSVSDTGPGVPDRARQHLFEAFKGSARPGGTGLGLAIADELVRAHGGAIRLIEPEPGSPFKGAVFEITLPDIMSG